MALPIADIDNEPPLGSILLLNGITGTSVQSHFSDGLYHASTGVTYQWEELFNGPTEPLIVHIAPEEELDKEDLAFYVWYEANDAYDASGAQSQEAAARVIRRALDEAFKAGAESGE